MKIDVLTLFPAMFAGPLDESIIKRARESGLLDLRVHNLRDYAHDRHRTVDDRPFGGGPGMLLKPEPIFEAVENLTSESTRIILLSPSGRTFNQAIAAELAESKGLLLISGHYEGSRHESAGCTAFGRPRGDRPLARRAGSAPNERTQARPAVNFVIL